MEDYGIPSTDQYSTPNDAPGDGGNFWQKLGGYGGNLLENITQNPTDIISLLMGGSPSGTTQNQSGGTQSPYVISPPVPTTTVSSGGGGISTTSILMIVLGIGVVIALIFAFKGRSKPAPVAY